MVFPFKIYRIQGHSMEPTILAGSFVLAWCWTKNYRVGDIIAFIAECPYSHGRKNMDTCGATKISGRTNLYQKSTSVFDGRQKRQLFDNGQIFIKRVALIKNDQFEVRGDNKTDSLDSGQLGLIHRSTVIGKVVWK